VTRLTLDLRNLLVQTPEVLDYLEAKIIGRGQAFTDGWIFDSVPYTTIEKKSHQALIVITQDGTWQAPNEHNNMRFVRVLVDVWASPTRKADGSVQTHDADYLIEEIMKSLWPYLHTVNMDVAPDAPVVLGQPGKPRIWGTAAQIEARTGSLVLASQSLGEPQFSDVRDGNGARMGRYAFGVSTV
jgi:hypothetical protein